MVLHAHDIVSITDFTAEEILALCAQASAMRQAEETGQRYAKTFNTIKRLATLFYEPSTRTAQSFKTAIMELGGRHEGFSGKEGTSVAKKETIRDTIKMFEANHFDALVMRHPRDGSVQWAADVATIPVINGGDGKNEHPTQSLLDVYSLYELNGKKLDNISIGFGGDLANGRTVRSLCLALSHFSQVRVFWAAPDIFAMPEDLIHILEKRGVSIQRMSTVEHVLDHVSFYYMTRPQLERIEGITTAEVTDLLRMYRIDEQKMRDFNGTLFHPLPVNGELSEIEYEVFFMPQQGFFRQAENGVLMRKAILFEMLSKMQYSTFRKVLSKDLFVGNNVVQREISTKTKQDASRTVKTLEDGTVIDHLRKGTEIQISKELKLVDRGMNSVTANIKAKTTAFIKTNLPTLTNRELKIIDDISPEPTINYIVDGSIKEKFVFLLCKNANCITRVIHEDVPPKFYMDGITMRCRYCRHPYTFTNKKLSQRDLQRYKSSLPKKIDPVA